MNPGDLFEWVYKRNGQCVAERGQLWSSLIHHYVPIGSGLIHILVSIDEERIVWMNEEGLFHARVDDVRGDTTGIVTCHEGNCEMVPGDLIEWVYKSSHMVVDKDEEMWSTLMHDWVPIGSGLVHTLISIDNEQITWMNEEGLFHARTDDAWVVARWGNSITLFHARTDDALKSTNQPMIPRVVRV